MYDFVYNVLTKSITVRKDNEIIYDEFILDADGFEFRCQQWCERWMDEHELENDEYRVFIRIH